MAEDTDDSQKTEEPTHRKLEKSREKGQVAQSQEVKHVFCLGMAVLVMGIFLPMFGTDLAGGLGHFLTHLHEIDTDPGAVLEMLKTGVVRITVILAIPLLLFMISGAAASLVQFGFLLSAENLKPNLNKLSPLKGLKRMFGLRSVVELVKGIIKISLVGAVAYLLVSPLLGGGIETLAGAPMDRVLTIVWREALMLMAIVTALTGALAAVDYAYQRFDFMKQQRMTKQEVKDEYKQTEGDPHVKGRLRSIRQQRARQRMMAAVPQADVVVTNPTHFAVAMRYDPEQMTAPRVVAKGIDTLALKMREVAEDHEVAVVENPPLARALYAAVEIDREVPPEHYKAVAEVISYVFRLQNRTVDRPAEGRL